MGEIVRVWMAAVFCLRGEKINSLELSQSASYHIHKVYLYIE